MKKRVIVLLLTLLMTITAFSSNTFEETKQDSIVSITSKQLKETNLIFVEHSKLLKENSLLIKQVDNYKHDNNLLLEADSIRNLQIENYQAMSESYRLQLKTLDQEIKKKNKTLLIWKIGGVTVSTGLLLFLLLK